jgi:hypothetical protein
MVAWQSVNQTAFPSAMNGATTNPIENKHLTFISTTGFSQIPKTQERLLQYCDKDFLSASGAKYRNLRLIAQRSDRRKLFSSGKKIFRCFAVQTTRVQIVKMSKTIYLAYTLAFRGDWRDGNCIALQDTY